MSKYGVISGPNTENTDLKKLRIWTIFTYCIFAKSSTIDVWHGAKYTFLYQALLFQCGMRGALAYLREYVSRTSKDRCVKANSISVSKFEDEHLSNVEEPLQFSTAENEIKRTITMFDCNRNEVTTQGNSDTKIDRSVRANLISVSEFENEHSNNTEGFSAAENEIKHTITKVDCNKNGVTTNGNLDTK